MELVNESGSRNRPLRYQLLTQQVMVVSNAEKVLKLL